MDRDDQGRLSESAAAGRRPGPPAHFIVGVPRSGTTLLRMQLDAHPDLAIPAETGFALVVAALAPDACPKELLDELGYRR
jgi:hypothetical protein